MPYHDPLAFDGFARSVRGYQKSKEYIMTRLITVPYVHLVHIVGIVLTVCPAYLPTRIIASHVEHR